MESRWTDIGGPVHYLDVEGPADGPTFVLVHGLGGSHTNWLGITEPLSRLGRVLVPDLIGFGRTPLDGRSASVPSNRLFLDRFIEQQVGGPVVLMGNSMGGLIGALQASTRPESVSGLVLVAPALPRTIGTAVDKTVAAFFAAYMIPRVGEAFVNGRVRSLGPERLVEETMRMCMADPARVSPELVEAQLQIARERIDQPWATTAFLEAARSLVRILGRRKRLTAMMREISAPTLLIAGAKDRLVPLAACNAMSSIRSDWQCVTFDELGHAPQLEDPREFMNTIEAWLQGPASWVLRGSRSLWGEVRAPYAEAAPTDLALGEAT